MAGRTAACAAAIAIALALAPAIVHAEGPGDEWEVVEDHKTGDTQAPAKAPSAPTDASQAAPQQEFTACGERARPAQEPYTSIVATLDHMWGSDAKIYESVEPASPHARDGGCIFYNREFLQELTKRWMGIDDPDQLQPMLYAINAHELGHIVHGDLSAARAGVPPETKELQADRFAGYTLWRLNVKRFDAADTERYYQAVGDDFVGAQGSHGTGKQRTSAFQDGWDLARIGLPEDSNQRPAGGLDSGEIIDPVVRDESR